MGKKKAPLQKKDVFQRLNFLFQAAYWALSMTPPNTILSKHYISTLMSLALKNVVRLNPSVKRTICKQCKILLVPGVTCKVRRKRKSKKFMWTVTTCLECGSFKRLPIDSSRTLWHDRPENIADIVTV